MMVAAVSGAPSSNPPNSKIGEHSHSQHSQRSPLLPSEKDNSSSSNGRTSNQRKPKSRIVSSRYLSPSPSSSSFTSRRHPSPAISCNSTPPSSLGPKRAVSVDRRRPAASRPLISDLGLKNDANSDATSAASKLLITSTRRLSVSFQGEGFSLPISKAKPAPVTPNSNNVRKVTPERRRVSSATPSKGKSDLGGDHLENLPSSIDRQHRWPARNRLVNSLSKSLDCRGEDRTMIIGSRSMIDERSPSFDGGGRPSFLNSSNSEALRPVPRALDRNPVNSDLSIPCDLTASDSESVSSGSTSGVQERNGGRGIAVPARFWQETNVKFRRFQDPGSPMSTSPGSKLIVPPKLKRYSIDGPLSSPRTMSSPVRGGVRHASPSKAMMTPVGSSPSRGYSPSRIRNAVSTISNSFVETPSVLSFAVDVRRGKVGENRIVDAHLLRLMYNRHLQWQFVNARVEAVLLVQKHNAEKDLWNAWITISDLRDTVTKKRHRLQLLKQKLKLASILKGQMVFLEDWASLDKDLSISMVGAIEALKGSTLRLPVIEGATADVQSLKDAVGSAFDVMHAMASSTLSLLPVVEESNSLLTELTKLTAKEQALLKQCSGYLSSLTALQVKDGSVRTHIVQHHHHHQHQQEDI